MKYKTLTRLVLLAILTGLAACRENTPPTTVVIVTEQATPIVVTVVATTEPVPTPAPIEVEEIRFQSDHFITRDETIYFEMSNGVADDLYRSRLVNDECGEPENLGAAVNTDDYEEYAPFIDPDEDYLIFASNRPGGFGGNDLYISFQNPDGSWTEPRNMGDTINSGAGDTIPYVSPDGEYFFFITRRAGDRGYYNPYWVDAQIIEDLRSPAPLDGRGGGVIAFASDRDGRLAIHVMNADGSDQRRLTDFADMEAYPDWSPDGKQIAFHAHHGSRIWSIHVMNADGSNRRRLTDSETRDAAPVWSPDGTQIVFSRDGDVWVMNVDGSDQRQLTTDPAGGNFADWSPDGTQIVFCSERDGNWEVYVMAADGTEPQRLTDNDADDWWPDWSPDGSQIAFKSGRDGNFEIYVMNADGTDQRRLTDNFAEDGEPDWSSDGTQIAFESNRDGNFKVYVMNADGTDQRRLTETLARDIMPAWRPALQATTNGPVPVAISVDTVDQVERLHTLSGHSDRVMTLAFSPDGSLLASGGYDNQVHLWGIPR